jgi:hypothetical protein
VKVGSLDSEIEGSIGVRQGSCEGPVLFLFIKQAALETMKWPVLKPELCTRENGVTMDERTEQKRGKIKHEHCCSLHADDAVFFLNTKDGLEKGASRLHEHLPKVRTNDAHKHRSNAKD